MTNKTDLLKGLYAITDHNLCLERSISIEPLVERAITGGAKIIQYRNKQSPRTERLQEARQLVELCRKHHAILLINDDVDLAVEVDADGVHLGQTDTSLAEARKRLGEDKIIGITCHNDLDLAREAQRGGADYVAFGRFFPSKSKPSAPPATISVLEKAHLELSIPVCAIGGITLDNASQLIEKGADMLAVVNDIFAAEDVARAAREFSKLFSKEKKVAS